MRLRKILYPANFNETSVAVLESLYSLKEAGLQELIFFHSVHYDEAAVSKSYGFDRHIADELTESARLHFMEWGKRASIEGLRSRYVIELGKPADKIIEIACREEVDLIVLGERRRTPLDSIYLGGIGMEVLRRSPKPVMLYKSPEPTCLHAPDPAHPLKKVVFPTDFSEASEAAFKFLKGVAGAVKNVEIVNLLTDDDFSAHKLEEIRGEEEGRLKLLEGMAAELLELGVIAETRIYAGDASKEIVAACIEREATSVVMGTTGRKGIMEAIKGSLSHRIAEKAPVPVFLIPLPKETPC